MICFQDFNYKLPKIDFLLTYDKLQQWVCHRERKKRSEIGIYLFFHLKTIIIFLTTAAKKGACIILALSRSEAWHGWGENLTEIPLLEFIQVQLYSCLVCVLRRILYIICFNVQHQPSPGINLTCCMRVRPTTLSSQCGDK